MIALLIPAAYGCYWLWARQSQHPLPVALNLHDWALKGFAAAGIAALAMIGLAIWIFRGFLIADRRVASLKAIGILFGCLTFVGLGLAWRRYQVLIDSHGVNQILAIQMASLLVLAVCIVLCVVKIILNMNASWLLQRQGWVAACGLFLFLVLPVDRWIHRHNVSCILEGNLRPVTHIANSQLKDESLPELVRLCEFEQPVIREGTAAIVANRLPFIKAVAKAADSSDWTAIQWGVQKDLQDLQKAAVEELVSDETSRELAHERLREYCRERQWM